MYMCNLINSCSSYASNRYKVFRRRVFEVRRKMIEGHITCPIKLRKYFKTPDAPIWLTKVANFSITISPVR